MRGSSSSSSERRCCARIAFRSSARIYTHMSVCSCVCVCDCLCTLRLLRTLIHVQRFTQTHALTHTWIWCAICAIRYSSMQLLATQAHIHTYTHMRAARETHRRTAHRAEMRSVSVYSSRASSSHAQIRGRSSSTRFQRWARESYATRVVSLCC